MKKNILLIGVGGTGSKAVDIFFKKKNELGSKTDNKITALVFDTDAGDLKNITAAKTVAMADSASVGTICDRIGRKYLREWFPCDVPEVRAQEMVRGAAQWRKKSYLAFLNLMNKPSARSTFISALEDMVKDPGASCEVYVIASVAGGTGSGSFIPIALYAKRYLRKNLGKDPIVNAMIALPDIYAESQTPENKIKVFSNAYAILRELNAINLVARGYNDGTADKKKAPIRFVIGHPDEPNVGVLFDASDERFWTPEAAPFSQIFLLDRIPGIDSIEAHNIVLANSLYTILCTEIGSAFDSEASNHELVRSQNNGSNAIYAGISSAQIKFPAESVLDYLAHKKTYESCDNDWLVLHNEVESAIRTKEIAAKDAKRGFSMGDGEYAKMVIETKDQLLLQDSDVVSAIVERCVDRHNKKNNLIEETQGEHFLKTVLIPYIGESIPKADDTLNTIDDTTKKKKNNPVTKNNFAQTLAPVTHEAVVEYYSDCCNAIKTLPGIIVNSMITFDAKKQDYVTDKYSIEANLLMKGNAHLHPVAALIRLCELRAALTESIETTYSKVTEWDDLKRRTVKEIPKCILESDIPSIRGESSAYKALGIERFNIITKSSEAYFDNKNGRSARQDVEQLRSDANTIVNKIQKGATAQISARIYKELARRIDILINKYRAFFNRFAKEKEDLLDMVKDAHRRDAGHNGSVINVYSSKDDKDAICAIIDENNGPITDSQLRVIDDITGRGVYTAVLGSAIAETSNKENYNDNDSKIYRSIFTSIVDATRESILISEAYQNIASLNVIEAIIESYESNPDKALLDELLHDTFAVAQDLATPSIRLEPKDPEADLVDYSTIMVFMLSKKTAAYIKRNLEKFGIDIPSSDNTEDDMLKACAEVFIKKYSGNTGARVVIMENIPDNIMYCTGETMDITPLRIAKFNEMGTENIYFKNYQTALDNADKYDTDMWNPHLGYNLHKRGCLPYMNAKMEDVCDIKTVKALLYTLYSRTVCLDRNKAIDDYKFRCDGKDVKTMGDKAVTNKNISLLFNWLRHKSSKEIDDWSNEFDKIIAADKAKLPTIVSDTELGKLETALTNTTFMKMLNDLLYEDPSQRDSDIGPTATEFAYQIKTSEEKGCDCDDADRIIRVLYGIFVDMIEYCTSPDVKPHWFVDVYNQQLCNFYEAFAKIDFVYKAREDCEKYFDNLVQWINGIGCFMCIDPDNYTIDANNKIVIDRRFDRTRTGAKDVGVREVRKVLEDIKASKKK